MEQAQLTIVTRQAITQFTPEEDAVIIKKIQESPNNITYATELAARELNRTPKSVYGRYYSKLKKDPSVVAHSLSSPKGYVNNIKNTPRPVEEDNGTPFETILENFSRLTRKQAKIIFDIFGGK